VQCLRCAVISIHVVNELKILCQASVSHRQTVGADRRQLSQEIQKLRVELSQKNLKLESVEADCQHKITELEQKLGEALHQRQLLQVSVSVCHLIVLS